MTVIGELLQGYLVPQDMKKGLRPTAPTPRSINDNISRIQNPAQSRSYVSLGFR